MIVKSDLPKILLSSNMKGVPAEKIFSCAKSAGFDGVEYVARLRDLFIKPKKIVLLSKKYDVPILSLHQPLFTIFYLPRFLFMRLIGLKKYFPKTKIYVVHLSSVFCFSQDRIKSFTDSFKTKRVLFSFESNNSVFVFKSFPKETYIPNDFAEFCKDNNLPITLDCSHIACFNKNIAQFLKENGPFIFHIHLSDYGKDGEHLMLGQGDLPIKAFLKILRKTRYKNFITFEIRHFKNNLSKEEKLNKLKEGLDLVRKYLYE